jgi:hypothetical protein
LKTTSKSYNLAGASFLVQKSSQYPKLVINGSAFKSSRTIPTFKRFVDNTLLRSYHPKLSWSSGGKKVELYAADFVS